MKNLALVLAALLAACGDDGSNVTPDAAGGVVARGACETLKRQAHDLRAGTCVLPSTPVGPLGASCPAIWSVLCGTDGAIEDCPDGFGATCDEPSPGTYINCGASINSESCVPAGPDRVSYPAVATLMGRDGLIVLVGNECEFRACE